jgi:hypothetical protein
MVISRVEAPNGMGKTIYNRLDGWVDKPSLADRHPTKADAQARLIMLSNISKRNYHQLCDIVDHPNV